MKQSGHSTIVPSRRTLLGAISSGLLLGALGAIPSPAEAKRRGIPRKDQDILNFALNLEYLEAEFYLFATTGAGLAPGDTQGDGAEGSTTGGAQVPFVPGSLLETTAREITNDEVDHVRLIRSVLGGNAVGKPRINLGALGIGFASPSEFLVLSRVFEDVGVSAYLGAAPLITSSSILSAAGAILAVEAYHAGNIRFQVVQMDISTPKVDGKDQPPTDPSPFPPMEDPNFFPTDENGLAIPRTVEEVLALVAPFFPDGLNGRIR